ncbi:hypothetical protein [Streptomyces sp. NPDC005476]|uniref:hypothetical protein n=1 Tax=Streptomyces sp. NPDC005476 TaxID=3156882 RepID=UPI0034571A4D
MAEAVTGLGYQAAPDPGAAIRIHIDPVAARGLDMDHWSQHRRHPAKVHKLTEDDGFDRSKSRAGRATEPPP